MSTALAMLANVMLTAAMEPVRMVFNFIDVLQFEIVMLP
jgi:hypothetical protein